MREVSICEGCHRHVFVEDDVCPFCGASERTSAAALSSGAGRLSRVAAHAARTAFFLTAVACYDSHSAGEDRSDADMVDAGGPGGSRRDGAVAAVDAGGPGGADGPDAGRADAGALMDAGAGTDGGASDAGLEGDAGDADVSVPLYGGVFPDPRKRAVV